MDKNWILNTQHDNNLTNRLALQLCGERFELNSKEFRTYFIIATLLCQRGITDFDKAKHFFRPSLSTLHSPFLMDDMQKAIDRIDKALTANEKVLVYGDYDVDGTCAVALVYSYLKKYFAENKVDFYIPDRYHEGYGVSLQAIDWACERGFSLIISLDCGIKAIEQVKYAAEKGIDFIICDHHIPDEQIPQALAVLDPKCPDSHYPYKELTGCGIGFKLVQALNENRNGYLDDLVQYLDLVVLSIVADVVPVTDENRVLAFFGLQRLNNQPRKGIEILLSYANINKSLHNKEAYFTKTINMTDLAFNICPRLNSAGRMRSGEIAVKILITNDKIKAKEIAYQMNECNELRKKLDKEATDEALTHLAESSTVTDNKSTILYYQNWHKGVIGIVAARLIEHYYKPTIIFTKSEDYLVGSARSICNFDIHNAIAQCSDLLEHFGGHKSAAGLTIKEENFEQFAIRFEQIVRSIMVADNADNLMPSESVDFELSLNDIDNRLMRLLKQFEPFGTGNPEPVFVTRHLKDAGYAKQVGINHLKFMVIHPDKSSYPIDAIGFSLADRLPDVRQSEFDICYNLTENTYNGSTSLQLNVKNIRICD
jgi:single-stranded-DNA-specific exonuclease